MKKLVEHRSKINVIVMSIATRASKQGSYLLWSFADQSRKNLVGFTEDRIIPGNKTWRWLRELGINVSEGNLIDFNDVKGKQCNAYLDNKGIVRAITYLTQSEKPRKLTPPPNQELREGEELVVDESLFE